MLKVLVIVVISWVFSCDASMNLVGDALSHVQDLFNQKYGGIYGFNPYEHAMHGFNVPELLHPHGHGAAQFGEAFKDSLQHMAHGMHTFPMFGGHQHHDTGVPPMIQEHNTHSYHYKGFMNTSGARSGVGILVSDHDGSVYVGGFCGDRRHGIGISFTPARAKSKFSVFDAFGSNQRRYMAAVHKWHHGFVLELVCEPSSIFHADIVNLITSMENHGIDNDKLHHLFEALHLRAPKAQCNDTLATTAVSQTHQHHVHRIPVSFIPARIGGSLSLKHIAYGNTELPRSQYDNSVFIPFTVSESKEARIMILSTTEGFYPIGTLWVVDENVLHSANKLQGSSLGFGFEFSADLDKSKRYYLEVGTPKGAQKTVGSFKVLIVDASYISQLRHEVHSVDTGEYVYKLSVGGDFFQVRKSNNETYRVGTFSSTMTPFYNKADKSITYYYTGGDKCGNTPRSGKLVITNRDDNDKLELTGVTESPMCVYTAFAKSRYTWKYRAELQKAD